MCVGEGDFIIEERVGATLERVGTGARYQQFRVGRVNSPLRITSLIWDDSPSSIEQREEQNHCFLTCSPLLCSTLGHIC